MREFVAYSGELINQVEMTFRGDRADAPTAPQTIAGKHGRVETVDDDSLLRPPMLP